MAIGRTDTVGGKGLQKALVNSGVGEVITNSKAQSIFFNALVWLVLAFQTIFFVRHTIEFALDDSYITYRYAQHVATGYGPVFNPGEQYLGTTAPGFALLLALLYLVISHLPVSDLLGGIFHVSSQQAAVFLDIPHLARYVSGLSVAAIALVGYGLLARSFQNLFGRIGGFLLALWIMTMPQAALVTGHETLTYIALVLAGLYFFSTRLLLCSVLIGAATLVRPDAAIAFGVIALAVGLRWLVSEEREIDTLLPQAGKLLGFFVPILPWGIFAWLYYGSPLPGTLLAKQAQVSMHVWQVASFGQLTSLTLSAVTGFAGPVAVICALLGLVVAFWRRNQLALVGAWGLLYLAAYSFLGVTFWGWYATPLYVVYLIFVFYGGAIAVEALWSLPNILSPVKASSLLPNFSGILAPRSMVTQTPAGQVTLFNAVTAGIGAWAESIRQSQSTKPIHNRLQIAVVSIALLAIAGVATNIAPNWVQMTSQQRARNHTTSFREVEDYIRKAAPNGTTIATVEPGALAYSLGPQYKVIDTLGLTSPGVSAHILQKDFTWPYTYYDPDWVIVTYEGRLNPNVSQQWFQLKYSKVAEFHHPYWDAQKITIKLFEKNNYTPGPNLLADANFEKSPTTPNAGWIAAWGKAASVMSEADGKVNSVALSADKVSDTVNVRQDVPVAAGKKYLVSFKYRNELSEGTQRVFFQVKDKDDKALETLPTGEGFMATATDKWTEGSFTVDTPANAVQARLWLRNRGVGKVWFSDVRVQELVPSKGSQ